MPGTAGYHAHVYFGADMMQRANWKRTRRFWAPHSIHHRSLRSAKHTENFAAPRPRYGGYSTDLHGDRSPLIPFSLHR